MLLKFNPFTGPREWKFVDPDTEFKYQAPDENALYAHIKAYRAQNELPPIEFLEATVENYLCGLPENSGACGRKGVLKRGIFQYIKGGIVLLQNVAYRSFVSKEEADRRAAICVKCPHNVFPDRDAFIKWADALAEASVGDRKSSLHNELGNCEICSCPMRAKVFYDGPIKLSDSERSKLPGFCWQIEAMKKHA